MIALAIALGLGIGLTFELMTGIAPGGLVVPGYFAMYMDEPGRLATTVLIALVAYGAIRLLDRRLILYGRRRAALVILIAFALDWALVSAVSGYVPRESDALATIGHIVPGLLASNMARHGPLFTLLGTSIVAVVVRLLLLLILGGASPA